MTGLVLLLRSDVEHDQLVFALDALPQFFFGQFFDLVALDAEGARATSEYRKALGDDDGAEAFAKQAEFIGG